MQIAGHTHGGQFWPWNLLVGYFQPFTAGLNRLHNLMNAASVTLALGTTAKVTNLETGRSAIVTIRDRGPYVRGRIVDLSPATARKIGLERKQGLVKVEVAPLTVPLPDGTVKVMSNALAMASS